jgi:hypothetical protein
MVFDSGHDEQQIAQPIKVNQFYRKLIRRAGSLP